MITLPMLTEYLKEPELREVKLLPDDPVASARVRMDGKAEQTGVLYLTPAGDDSCTRCHTRRGSSFLIEGDLFTVLEQVLDGLEYYRAWEDELTAACQRGCTLTELLDLSHPVLPCPMFILDANQWTIAYSTAFENEPVDADWSDMVHLNTSSAAKISAYNSQFSHYFQKRTLYSIPGDVFPHRGYAINLFYEQVFCGVVVLVERDEPVTPGTLGAFEILCRHIQNMIRTSSSNLSLTLPGQSLSDYLTRPEADTLERLERTLRLALWQDADPKVLIRAAPASASHLAPNPFHSRAIFSRMDGLLVTMHQNGLVLLCNLRALKKNAGYEQILQWLGRISYCAGVSGTFAALDQLPAMLHQADVALRHGDQTAGAVNAFEDHVLSYLLSVLQKADREILRHPCMDQLRRYDRHHGSRLYETLFAYLENERSLSKTAAALNIHRSTLIHRMERLEEVLPVSLDVPEVRLHLLLSFYAQRGAAPEQ